MRRIVWALVAGAGLTVLVAGGVALLGGPPQAAPPPLDASGRPNPGVRVRVEVLNAGGVAGVAGVATDRLRDLGFDVVYFGNAARWDHDSSVVLDRVGRPTLAWGVADALGIGNVRSEPDANLYVDVSVLLGSEWSAPAGSDSTSVQSSERGWWDPRGWIRR